MTFPTNFKFPYQVTGGVTDTSLACSPVQTVSTGSVWLVENEIQSLALGRTVSAAIKTDGTLWLWGNDETGVLGNNVSVKANKSSPIQTIACGTNWCQVSLNRNGNISDLFAAAIKTDGTLWLWGQGQFGQLGNLSTTIQSSPVQTVSTGTNWKQVSLGSCHSAAIKSDGTLWLWGYPTSGELGDDSGAGSSKSSPVQTVATGNNWKQVALGCRHSTAIKTDGTLWLWGCNNDGQLGNNTIGSNRSSPVQTISTGTNWKQVSAGSSHTAAIKTDGTLWIWGSNRCGQLGNNTVIDERSPIQTISTSTNWKQVDASSTTTNFSGTTGAIKTDGTLWMWGQSGNGNFGNNSTTDRSSPVQTVSATTCWKQISVGVFQSGAIKTDGTLWLWGYNEQGALGNNSTSDRSSPVQTVSAVTTWQVPEDAFYTSSLGNCFSSAIKTDGTLWLWGNNDCGRLGTNSTIAQSSPVQTVSTGNNWKQVSLGVANSAAIKTDGTLWLWGSGACGRLGINNLTSQSSPVQTVSTGANWKQVSSGCVHLAAVKTDGTLWLWGDGSSGRLGNNSTTDVSSPIQTVSTGTNWKQVSLGVANSAAIKTDGTLWLWGNNDCGRLGTNSIIAQSSPVQTVSTGTNWKQVSLACLHSAAIKTDGTLWLWGDVGFGRLGNNTTTTDRSSPVQTVAAGTNWKQVSLSWQHSSAIKTDGTLWLWGNNNCGQLGDNSTIAQSSPIQTACTGIFWQELPDHQGINHSGATTSTNQLYVWGNNTVGELGRNLTEGVCFCVCADFDDVFVRREIFSQGGLWGWGDNANGKLGNNSTINQSSPVQTISGGINWKQVRITCDASASIKTDGTLWMWGKANCGRLGNNSTISQSSPVQTVSTGTNWKQVSLGADFSAAIKTDGTLWLWGSQEGPGGQIHGQLGTNSTISQSSPVQTVTTGTNWKQVSLGEMHAAAIKTDGTLWLWGNGNGGRLGDNTAVCKSSPVQTVSTATNWKQVSSGTDHTSAIKSDGTLWLWGCNICGQLGTNLTISQSSPVQTVTTGTNWKQVEIYNFHSAAIKTDGTLWLWGSGSCGRLGNNSTIDVSSPVQTVSTTTNWKQVSLGECHSTAIKTDGTLWLWGLASCGRLGNNSTINQSSPVQTITTGTNWIDISVGCRHSFGIREDCY